MKDFSAGLNAPQKQAVEHVSGPLLIFASAGSGKTRCLTHRVANLVENHGADPRRMLVVTFTKKAAKEMGERLDALIGKAKVKELWLGTFHAMCARILRTHHDTFGRRRDFLIYDDHDQETVVKQVVTEMHLDKKTWPVKLILEKIEQCKQRALHPSNLPRIDPESEQFARIYERYEEWLKSCNAVDFNDLLLYTFRLCERKDAIGVSLRGMFDHVLVDEFQDTDFVQYEVVRLLGAAGNVCVVGDDDQCIYTWRQADPTFIREFKKQFPSAEVVKLEQNYRSTKNVVACAVGVITSAPGRVPKTMWTANEPGGLVEVVRSESDRREAEAVCSRVRAAIGAGVPLGQIAILYRMRVQSRAIEDQLRDWNVPYRIHGGHRFYDRSEVKDVVAYLRLLSNPDSDVDVLRVINAPSRGIGPTTVRRIAEMASSRQTTLWRALPVAMVAPELGRKERMQIMGFKDAIEKYQALADKERPSDVTKAILSGTGYERMLEQTVAELKKDGKLSDAAVAQTKLENAREVVSAVAAYESRCADRGDIPTLREYLTNVSLSEADDRRSDEQVTLMTVHASKGLEFDNVFVTGLEDGRFPCCNDADVMGMAEERRLCYVAITRARKRLWLTSAESRYVRGEVTYNPESRFLADLPAGAFVRAKDRRA